MNTHAPETCTHESEASEETLRSWVSSWQSANDDGGPGYFDPEDGSWTYDPVFPAQKLIDGGVFSSKEDAAMWLRGEIDMHRADGNEGRAAEYESLLVEPIRDAVYLTEVDGQISIWDGWHRSAAILARGDSTLAVVVGKPYANPDSGNHKKQAASP
jgi:hypothetical protein